MARHEYLIVCDAHRRARMAWFDTWEGTPPRDAAVAALVAMQSEGVPQERYLHVADLGLAAAWIRAARAMTAARIDAMTTPRAQYDAVVGVWRAFANYWKALNVRPYGWKRFRDACAAGWGEQDANGAEVVASAWRRRAVLDFDRGGAAVCGGIGRCPWRSGRSTQAAVRAGLDCASAYTGTERCANPTFDEHRIWMNNVGELGGWPCWPEEVGPNFSQVVGGPGLGWNTYARRTEVVAEIAPGGLVPFDSTGGLVVRRYVMGLWLLPAMRWYFDLLVPLLEYLAGRDPIEVVHEVRGDVIAKNAATANLTGLRAAELVTAAERALGTAEFTDSADTRRALTAFQGVTRSVIASFGAPGTAGVIFGVFAAVSPLIARLLEGAPDRHLDVFGRDRPVYEVFAIRETPLGLSDQQAVLDLYGPLMPPAPPGYAPRPEMDLADRTRKDAPGVGSVVASTNTFYGGVGGRAVDKLDHGLDTPDGVAPRATSKAVGKGGATSSELPDYGGDVSPPPPGTSPTVRIVGLPIGSGVRMDGVDVDAAGRWVDAAQTIRVVPAIAGAHDLRVTPPGAPERYAAIVVPTTGVLEVGFAGMAVVAPPVTEAPGLLRIVVERMGLGVFSQVGLSRVGAAGPAPTMGAAPLEASLPAGMYHVRWQALREPLFRSSLSHPPDVLVTHESDVRVESGKTTTITYRGTLRTWLPWRPVAVAAAVVVASVTGAVAVARHHSAEPERA